jgi:hypothetical protein
MKKLCVFFEAETVRTGLILNALTKEAASTSEKPVNFYHTAWLNIPEKTFSRLIIVFCCFNVS